ncbi:hypothetical protein [uncultured Microbulbifer sp.]|uniref:hypothetical protein n=1 Tax=uncultured Microbulbifer sp. TaxID=348147 RepID=UPI00263A3B1F|nr:hypothetical protein [uncultured Microbulbifer sp.]
MHEKEEQLSNDDFTLTEIREVDGAGIVTTTYEIKTLAGVIFTSGDRDIALAKFESLSLKKQRQRQEQEQQRQEQERDFSDFDMNM